MASIEDLDKISITDMSKGELINLLRDIRLSRRTPSKKVARRKPAAKRPTKPLNINNLTNEQTVNLIKQLEKLQ